MLTKEQLQWTERDDKIVVEHKRRIAAGEPVMNFLDIRRDSE